ncbi:Holliday junction resolvase RecU [Bacillus sp. BRMEA1]|nr:Holliday junction resolvase RecU [Neobacillus endophyticus]
MLISIIATKENKGKGKKQNAGKQFERDFYASVPADLFFYRLKDDSLGYLNVKNPCDFILYKYPTIYLFELKSHKGKSIPFSALQPFQVESLYQYSKVDGVKAGFVFNFRDVNETYFVDAVTVYQFYHVGERKSFFLEWAKENWVFIPQKLKRTRYQYDLYNLLNY